ncbi:MAG: PDZ domain-containing protein [bacterium]
MSSSYPASVLHSSRAAGHSPFVASLALLLLTGMSTAGAQQHIEITTRRAPRAEPADSSERQMRSLQRHLDSLVSVYNVDDQLNAMQRRQVEGQIQAIVGQLEEMSVRMSGLVAPTQTIRVRMAPLAAEHAAASMSRALMQVREAEQARPRGWIGFVAMGPGLLPRLENGELIVRYFAYPGIVSVDPSSPAQRAGITTSDTLLAYNGVDVRENDISLTRLLRPNTRVSVRLLRDGRVHEIPVTIAPAPTRIVQRRDDEVGVAREPWIIAGVPEGPSFPRMAPAPMPPTGTMRASARMPSAAAVPPSSGFTATRQAPTFFPGFSNPGVAGAQLTTITEGLSQTIGVSSGVLVTSAPMGSPASESGLRDGDVILKVGGQAVRAVSEVRDLVRLANDSGEHAVDVELLRQKKGMKIVLKW